jgi:hypothetical protein
VTQFVGYDSAGDLFVAVAGAGEVLSGLLAIPLAVAIARGQYVKALGRALERVRSARSSYRANVGRACAGSRSEHCSDHAASARLDPRGSGSDPPADSSDRRLSARCRSRGETRSRGVTTLFPHLFTSSWHSVNDNAKKAAPWTLLRDKCGRMAIHRREDATLTTTLPPP